MRRACFPPTYFSLRGSPPCPIPSLSPFPPFPVPVLSSVVPLSFGPDGPPPGLSHPSSSPVSVVPASLSVLVGVGRLPLCPRCPPASHPPPCFLPLAPRRSPPSFSADFFWDFSIDEVKDLHALNPCGRGGCGRGVIDFARLGTRRRVKLQNKNIKVSNKHICVRDSCVNDSFSGRFLHCLEPQ